MAHQATGKDGSTYYYIPAEFLLDERERRAGRLGNESVNKDISNADNEKNMYDIMDEMGLTYDEQRAILEYKSSGSYKINESLRKGKSLSKEQEKIKNDLNSAMDKFPIYKGVVYRNIGFNSTKEFNEFIKKHKIGSSILHPYFTSASKITDGYVVTANYNAFYEIVSENAKDVEQIGLVEEREVLFKTDTEFAIIDISVADKNVYVKLKELMNYGTKDNNRALENTKNGQNTEGRSRKTRIDGIYEGIYTENDSIREGSATDDRIFESKSSGNGERNRDDLVKSGREYEEETRIIEGTKGKFVRINNIYNQILSTISRARGEQK